METTEKKPDKKKELKERVDTSEAQIKDEVKKAQSKIKSAEHYRLPDVVLRRFDIHGPFL